jgi:hypothetical protein
MTDDLDDLLGPKPPAPTEAAVRDAIRRRTARVIRLRWWARRVGTTLAAAVLFAGGGVAGWVLKPTPAIPPPQKEYVVVPVPVVLTPTEPPTPEPSPTLEQLELRAETAASPADAARLYRLAGDRWLADCGDTVQAVRCYKLHLLAAGRTGLDVSPDDSWLLIALKRDIRKETSRDPDAGL